MTHLAFQYAHTPDGVLVHRVRSFCSAVDDPAEDRRRGLRIVEPNEAAVWDDGTCPDCRIVAVRERASVFAHDAEPIPLQALLVLTINGRYVRYGLGMAGEPRPVAVRAKPGAKEYAIMIGPDGARRMGDDEWPAHTVSIPVAP